VVYYRETILYFVIFSLVKYGRVTIFGLILRYNVWRSGCLRFVEQEAFEKCWDHSRLRAASRPLTRCRYRYCRAPPAHRCPRRQRQRRQRQRVTEGIAMAPWNGPNQSTMPTFTGRTVHGCHGPCRKIFVCYGQRENDLENTESEYSKNLQNYNEINWTSRSGPKIYSTK